MKANTWLIIFTGLTLLIMVSCSNNPITEDQNGKTIELSIDSRFQIQLSGNAGKGYTWKTVGLDRNILEQIGEPVVAKAKDQGGENDTFTFTFKTKSAGNTFLRLIYYNKNQEDPRPVKNYEIRVISGTMGRIES